MNLKHFGDSYDIVKQSLLQWLSDFGPWAAHPMFTHPVKDADATAFAAFLGVRLVSTVVLDGSCNRRAYLAACGDCRSIFLDPDTGVRLGNAKGKQSISFIFGDELVEIASARPQGLVLTFDQSLARGSEGKQVQAKLDHFFARGVDGFAYVSHASFLVLGRSGALVREAKNRLLAASSLPAFRIVTPAPPKSVLPSGDLELLRP
jgi:hypothetical protein